MKFLLAFFAITLASITTLAAQPSGLIINAAEIGVGKFHRADSQAHPKEYQNNVWADSIMPANAGKVTPVVFQTPDGAVSIQFSTLEELLNTIVAVSTQKHMKIAVLNINGHGMPGGMWFPKDEVTKQSAACADWNEKAQAPDQENYDEYYDAVPKSEILQLRAASFVHGHYPCVTGADEWKAVVPRVANIKSYFTEDAQVHFESCLVGLGPVGQDFTIAVGSLILGGAHSIVKAITNFGLGDWSMPEGMGFWDYFTDDQLNHDNEVYPKNRQDREIMKKGTIRVTYLQNGQWDSKLVGNQDFMLVGYASSTKEMFSNPVRIMKEPTARAAGVNNYILAPLSVRIPGTNVEVQRMN